ncbi:MAG: lysophospholipid acyltransferase family protein [Pseudomonadota bacterium]
MILQWLRSLIFVGQMYLMMLVMGIVFLPLALASPKGASFACQTYTRWVRWTARWMLGLRTEIRGTPPTGEVMIAAKHQSFLDIILIFNAMPRPKFIMKAELVYAPVIGQYARRLGSIPVKRGKRAEAIKTMLADVEAGRDLPGQLVIYPQGTRVAPRVSAPYKIGTGALYREMGQPCVPVATNVGHFWPRKGILRKPGLAVVEFLDPIAPGMPVEAFMETIETQIEARSNALLDEAEA